MRILQVLLLTFPFATSASSLKVNFTEGSFLKQYRHQTYIKDDNYLFVDDHFEYTQYISGQNVAVNKIPSVPDFYSRTLLKPEIKEIIETLKSFGVEKWKKRYPEDIEESKALICDGHTYNIYIETQYFKIESSGACFFPDNYNEVATYLMSVHQSPNKKSQ